MPTCKKDSIIVKTNLKFAGSDLPVYCLTSTDPTDIETVLLLPVNPLAGGQPAAVSNMENSSYFIPVSYTLPSQRIQYLPQESADHLISSNTLANQMDTLYSGISGDIQIKEEQSDLSSPCIVNVLNSSNNPTIWGHVVKNENVESDVINILSSIKKEEAFTFSTSTIQNNYHQPVNVEITNDSHESLANIKEEAFTFSDSTVSSVQNNHQSISVETTNDTHESLANIKEKAFTFLTSTMSSMQNNHQPVSVEITNESLANIKEEAFTFSTSTMSFVQNNHQPVSVKITNDSHESLVLTHSIKQNIIFESCDGETGGNSQSITGIAQNGLRIANSAEELSNVLTNIKEEDTFDSCSSDSPSADGFLLTKTENGTSGIHSSCAVSADMTLHPSSNPESSTMESRNFVCTGAMVETGNPKPIKESADAGSKISNTSGSENTEQVGKLSGTTDGILTNIESAKFGLREQNSVLGHVRVVNGNSQNLFSGGEQNKIQRGSTVTNSHKSSKEKLISGKARSPGHSTGASTAKVIEPLCKYLKGNECLLCGFKSKASGTYSMKLHLVTHLKDKKFACEICGKRFPAPARLACHRRVHSTDVEKCTCKKCGKRYRNVRSLQSHLQRDHSKSRHASCPVCGKQFTNSVSLKAHYRVHTGEKPYDCDQCGEKFRTRPELLNHIRTHNQTREFRCETCGKSYKWKALLREHMGIHKGTKRFECDVCGKSFNFKSNLTQHKMTHSDSRRHSCGICGMKFKFPHHLRSHKEARH